MSHKPRHASLFLPFYQPWVTLRPHGRPGPALRRTVAGATPRLSGGRLRPSLALGGRGGRPRARRRSQRRTVGRAFDNRWQEHLFEIAAKRVGNVQKKRERERARKREMVGNRDPGNGEKVGKRKRRERERERERERNNSHELGHSSDFADGCVCWCCRLLVALVLFVWFALLLCTLIPTEANQIHSSFSTSFAVTKSEMLLQN